MSKMTENRESRLSGLARRLVAFGVSADRRDEIVDDLREGFSIRSQGGKVRARFWYVRQLLAFVSTGVKHRLDAAVRPRRKRVREGWVASWLQDLRFGVRGLIRAPAFAFFTVVTLAVGIGGTTAVFSVVDGVLLRPLPFPNPERLGAVLDTFNGNHWWNSSPRNVLRWREHAMTVEGIAWAQPDRRNWVTGDEPREVRVQRVSGNFLDVLGVRPFFGRAFDVDDENVGAAPVAILTHSFWRRLGTDSSIVGTAVVLDEVPHTVVGILPAEQHAGFLGPHDLLVPRVFSEGELRDAGRVLTTVARLRSATSFGAVAEEFENISGQPGGGANGWGVELTPLREQLVGDVRSALFIVLGSVTFVLLVACVNVSNLLLARGSRRTHEFALRTALGAGRGRIARQLLTEAGVLALLAGGAGVLLAMWGVDGLVAMAPEAFPRMDEIAVHPRVLVFAVAVSCLAGLMFGLAPAIRCAADTPGNGLLRARTASAGGGGGIRSTFVVVEVAFVLLLLAGAGLMLESFSRLRSIDPGFPTSDRLVLEITPPKATHTDDQRVSRFFSEYRERLRSFPGVVAAGVITHAPFVGDDWSSYQVVENQPEPRPGEELVGGLELTPFRGHITLWVKGVLDADTVSSGVPRTDHCVGAGWAESERAGARI